MKRKTVLGIYEIICILLMSIPAAARIRVVTTIPDFGALATEVGGDKIEVAALVRPTQDPHFVDAKPSFVVALNRADVLLLTGMELEVGWLPPLLSGARNRNIQSGAPGYVDCSKFITPMDVQRVDRSKGDIHPGGNPHYWTAPKNGLRIAKGITNSLCTVDSTNCDYYKKRHDAFAKKLKARIVVWEKRLKKNPRTVVVYHDSWGYFLRWSGFKKAGTLEPKPGVPPKPSHVAHLLQQTKGEGRKVNLVLQESFYPTNLSRLFATKSGARLAVLPTMVGAAGTHSYIELIEKIVKEVTK